MAIKGIFFDNQTFNAKDFGAFASALGDCIIGNYNCTINSNVLTIPNCYVIVGGRLFMFDSNYVINLAPSVGNGYGRVVVTIDLTKQSTESTFNQIAITTEYASSLTGFNDLTKNDINLSGATYQAALLYFKVTSSVCSITDETRDISLPNLSDVTHLKHTYDTIRGGTMVLSPNNYGSTLPSSGVEGQIFFKI